MIIVRVELHSAITGDVTELARMVVFNKGNSRYPLRGDYVGQTLKGRTAADLARSQDRGTIQRQGEVLKYQRQRLHVWHLVAKMLASMGYGA